MPDTISELVENNTSNNKPKTLSPIIVIVLSVLMIGLGVFTGYYFSGKSGLTTSTTSRGTVPENKIVKGGEFGVQDPSKFKDTATGALQSGGIDGEGTHQLVREGGPSQTVYLTSSILDLDQFVGKKVQVWGETFKAQKAGWLMDVGKLKILE